MTNIVPMPQLTAFERLATRYPPGSLQDASSLATALGLYGLVRMIQPAFVVEIGTWEGTTSLWLARAVMENGRGRYRGYEVTPEKAGQTRAALEEALPGGPWEVKAQNFLDETYIESDFVFMDHEKTQYAAAMGKILTPVGGYVLAHDTQAWPEAVHFYQQMQLARNWEVINLPQERGLMVARKLW